MVNLLPLEQGERITTILPLPEDEASWDDLDVMFATTGGTVRRNKLSDFVEVQRTGKIAMKLDEGEAIVGVQICTERDDVLLTTRGGQCIRFPVADVRVFTGPRLHRRARHRAGGRRRGDLPGDPAPCRRHAARSAPPISSAPARCGAASTRRPRRPRCRGRCRGGRGRRSSSGEQRYAELSRGRAVRADDVRARLRQAHLLLRIPHHRPRRQGHRRHGQPRARRHAARQDRPPGRLVPGGGAATSWCWSPTAAS